MKNAFSLLRGSSEVYQVKIDKLRKALFIPIYDNNEYHRNGTDYNMCKSTGI